MPVSLQQWLAQLVAHIHRAGPGNQPGIVLALLYRLDAARVRELTLGGRARLAAGTGGGEETWLREHPGTKANLKEVGLYWVHQWCEEEQGTCHLHLPTAPAPPWRPGGTGLFPFH